MKRIWIACGLMLAILAGTLGHSVYIDGFIGELSTLLETAEAQAEGGDWEEAAALTRRAWERWQDKDLYLHITLRHDETDQVYTGFREVLEFLQCQEGGEYSAANAELIANLELMAEAEQLTWKNIL